MIISTPSGTREGQAGTPALSKAASMNGEPNVNKMVWRLLSSARDEPERRPGGLRRHDGPHDARAVAVVLRVVRVAHELGDRWPGRVEGDIPLNAARADPPSPDARARWNQGLS